MNESAQYVVLFSSWILTTIFSLYLLIRFWGDSIGRVTILYTFKPTMVFFIAKLIPYSGFQPYHIAVIEIIVSIVTIGIFWNLYKLGWRTPWIILILDTLRLSAVFVLPSDESYLETFLTLMYYLLPVFVAIVMTISLERKAKLSLKQLD